MKKFAFVLLACFALFATSTKAQDFKPTVFNPTSAIVNTTPDTLSLNSAPLSSATVQVTVTKVSGTVSGKVYLYAGLYKGAQLYQTDSLTLSDQALNTVYWTLSSPNFKYYTVYFNPTGTVSATGAANLSGRK